MDTSIPKDPLAAILAADVADLAPATRLGLGDSVPDRLRQRLAFLAEAGTVLASSLDYDVTLANLAALAVPMWADWCIIDIVDSDDAIRRVAVVHCDPAKAAMAEILHRDYPLDPRWPDGIARAIRAGTPLFVPELTDERLAGIARNATHIELLRGLGATSGLCVPIQSRGRILGAITLIYGDSGRVYEAADLVLVEELAGRAAMAMDNALLYHAEQAARAAAEASVRDRDDFLSIASHELKTPLAALQLHLEQSIRRIQRVGDAPLDPVAVTARLQLANQQVTRLTNLVNHLLDVGRMTGNQVILEPEAVDLAHLLHVTVGRLGEELEKANCSVVLLAKSPLVGQWDRLRLEQVVTNLLGNAIKYGAGMPVELTAEADDRSVSLVVRDQGIGIALADQERIFHRFERSVSVRHYGGFGLGLWITRQIVTAMGGQIGVDSTPGEGAAFTVTLPLA